MENAAWYTWDEMTPWRFAILIGVALVTWIVIKLNDLYSFSGGDDVSDENDEFGEDRRPTLSDYRYSNLPGNIYHTD